MEKTNTVVASPLQQRVMRNGYIEKMWAVHGVSGLYTGTWFTRSEAIKAHVTRKYIIPSPKFPTIESAWRSCRRRGDKAVKVEIKYTA
jgi:hypothetical protein